MGRRDEQMKKGARSYKLGHILFSLISTFRGKKFSLSFFFFFCPATTDKDQLAV